MQIQWSDCLKAGAIPGATLIQGNTTDSTHIETDSRCLGPGAFFWPLKGPSFDGHAYVLEALEKGASGCVVAHSERELLKGKKIASHLTILEVPDTELALQQLAAYVRRQSKAQVIAITGSNGKTTTKEMLRQILSRHQSTVYSKKSFNNHIGVPLTLLQIKEETCYVVVEMGMNHAGEIQQLTRLADPDMGVILNVAPAHVGFFDGVEGVAKAKAEMADALSADKTLLLNYSLRQFPVFHELTRCRLLEFGPDNLELYASYALPRQNGNGIYMDITVGEAHYHLYFSGLGLFNVENVTAAVAVATFLNIPGGIIESGIQEFQGFNFRMERTKLEDDILCINDAYNSNPVSARAAIEVLDQHPCQGKRHLVFGSMQELGKQADAWHREMGERIRHSKIDQVYCLGTEAKIIASQLNHNFPGQACWYASKQEALGALQETLASGDLVLFKGSRSHALETLVQELIQSVGAKNV